MASVMFEETEGGLRMANPQCELRVDLTAGTWSVRDRRSGQWGVTNARFRVDRDPAQKWREPRTAISWEQRCIATVFGEGTELVISFTPAEGYDPVRMLVLRLYAEQPFLEVGWGIRNPFAYPVRIQTVELLNGAELFGGQRFVQPRVLQSGAGAEPNPVGKGWEVACYNAALLTCRQDEERRSLVAGGLAYAEFARYVDIRKGYRGERPQRRSKGVRSLNLIAWDPQGKLIEPGNSYWSPDTAYLDFVTADPFAALEAYGKALAAANDADPNVYDFPTLCGWMVSTKNLGEGKPINNSAGLVEQLRLARERGLMKVTPLAVRLEPDTYCYGDFGNTQQGWWDDEHWRAYGPGNGETKGAGRGSLQAPYDSFQSFCRAVAERGGIPFTYIQGSMPSNDFALAHPDWMLDKDISRLHHTHAHQKPLLRYDFSHPEFQEHCLQLWTRLRKAGLKGIKFDYPESAWASGGGFEDPSYTSTSAYRELFRLCRQGLGDEAFIHERNLGGGAHEDAPRLDATAGIVDLQRVWGDASHFEPEMASRIGLRWYKSRRVFRYYPDGKSFMMNGKPLPAYRRRAFLTIVAFLSGRLEIGTSIGSMSDEMLADMTRVFPVLGGHRSPRPVDMLQGGEHPSVYLYSVSPSWQQVMLLNNNKKGKKTVSVPLAGDPAETGALGLDARHRYHAFDFWRQAYLGILEGDGEVSAELRAGEAAMISLREVESCPQLLSTNRHIMQGLMECHGLCWSETQSSLSGEVDVLGGEALVVTLATNGWAAVACEGADMRSGGTGLTELVFQAEANGRYPFCLQFAGNSTPFRT